MTSFDFHTMPIIIYLGTFLNLFGCYNIYTCYNHLFCILANSYCAHTKHKNLSIHLKKHLVTVGLGQNSLQSQYVNIYTNIS